MAAQCERAHIHSGIPIRTKIFNTHFRRRKNGIIFTVHWSGSSSFLSILRLRGTWNPEQAIIGFLTHGTTSPVPFHMQVSCPTSPFFSLPPQFLSFYHIPVNTTVVLRLQTLCHLFLLGMRLGMLGVLLLFFFFSPPLLFLPPSSCVHWSFPHLM